MPQNILLTGGAGFIGSYVTNHLVTKYPAYRIVVLDVLDYCATMNNLAPSVGKPNFEFVQGDIGNFELVRSVAARRACASRGDHRLIADARCARYVMGNFKIDTVMHFAAQSHVDHSFGNSIDFTRTNVLGTHVLLECALRYNVKRFIHVSTDEVYGEIMEESAKETAQFEPTNPYSCSKAAAEFITKSYIKSFRLPVIITRGNNVYGPRQFPEKVIPKFILRLLHGQKCCLHGDGSARRTYVFAEDVARGFDQVLHYGEPDHVYNLGSEMDLSMKELAKMLIRLTGTAKEGEEEAWLEYVEDRKFNDCRYSIDSGKMRSIGWQPTTSFEDGLRMTIDWYRNLPPDYWDDYLYALSPHPPKHAKPRH